MAEARTDCICIAVVHWIWAQVKRPFISKVKKSQDVRVSAPIMDASESLSLAANRVAAVDWKYEVYLSFGGPDTRKGVIFELYDRLQRRGIKTFMDDRDLEAGDQSIPPTLTEAIRESRFAIVVLSRDYASSTWRLEELTAICECMKDQNRIFPVLYHAQPSDVRLGKGSFVEAFSDGPGQQGSDKMQQRWNEALENVATFSLWSTKDYKTHKELVEVIVKFLCSKVPLLPDATDSGEDFEESEPIQPVDDDFVKELPIVSSASQWEYDVFLSFRGLETRMGIASYLSHKLKRKGIRTFMDEDIKVGNHISSNLLAAINESRSAIVILSPQYASSTWCLDELVSIVQGWETRNKLVYPVFYNVEPHDVRYQTGSFKEIFTRLGKRKHREEELNQWKAALTTVANLKGIESKFYRSDRQLVETIVQYVCSQVRDGKGLKATLEGNVVKGIFIGAALCVAVGGLWKMYHWNEQRKVRTFYDLPEKGEISVVAEE